MAINKMPKPTWFLTSPFCNRAKILAGALQRKTNFNYGVGLSTAKDENVFVLQQVWHGFEVYAMTFLCFYQLVF